MTTKFVGLKDFRQNLATYTKDAAVKSIRFIILKRNIPVLEVKPVDEKEITLEKLAAELAEAEKDIKLGKVYSQEQIMREFGLI